VITRNKVIERNKLTFVLTPQKIYILNRLQAFYLEPREPYWKRRMLFIGMLVELGEVTDLDSLARYCGDKVRWVPTNRFNDNIRRYIKETHHELDSTI